MLKETFIYYLIINITRSALENSRLLIEESFVVYLFPLATLRDFFEDRFDIRKKFFWVL